MCNVLMFTFLCIHKHTHIGLMKRSGHISNSLCARIKRHLFGYADGRMMNWQALNLINSFNLEFNQQLNEFGDNENFSNTHCLRTCSLPSTLGTCVESERKTSKKSLKIVQTFDIYSHSVLTFVDMAEISSKCVRLSVMMTTAAAKAYRISYMCLQECILHYFSPLENCRIKKRISNEYLIEHSALQWVRTQIHEYMCVYVCAPAIKRTSENGYE